MIHVYADGALIYSPGLDGYELAALKATTDLEKAGTAEMTMLPGHPAYNSFTYFRTLVTIYRRGALLFRGRALYPEDDFYGRRKIMCEGERCFLRDGVLRPYVYQDTPAAIFSTLIGLYNAQVEPFKQFRVGTVTVTDPNDYVRLESETAEQVSDAIDRLIEQCGGYITFSTDEDGVRCINWLAEMDSHCGQAIEFGENLLDFSRSGSSTELYTAILPYGAENEKTKKRVTVESVNGGLDYIQDDAAVALYGFIAKPVYWDDVTKADHLLAKAKQELDACKLIVTSLELSAVDLSALDRDIDTFSVGDWVPVYSAPHGLNDLFLLRTRTYDLLNPANDKVAFGKELATLTGAGVANAKSSQAQILQTAASIKTGYTQAIAEAKEDINPTDGTVGELRAEMALAYGAKVNASGQYMTSDGLLLQWGFATVTQTAALTFVYPYADTPSVVLTPLAADPTGLSVSLSAVSAEGATIITTAAEALPVYWLAIGNGAASAASEE